MWKEPSGKVRCLVHRRTHLCADPFIGLVLESQEEEDSDPNVELFAVRMFERLQSVEQPCYGATVDDEKHVFRENTPTKTRVRNHPNRGDYLQKLHNLSTVVNWLPAPSNRQNDR
jgi:hypothetical protein